MGIVDEPKCLREETECAARRELLHGPTMRELTAFVQAIRSEVPEGDVPDFDPLDGGVDAECLFLLEAPGPRAVKSGFVSRNNPDETAKNWHVLNGEVGINRRRTITWNIVPWYIGKDSRIRPAKAADIKLGLPYLQQLILLLPKLRLVVLVGRKAGHAEASVRQWAPGLDIMEIPHPSPSFVNRAPGNRGLVRKRLKEVAKKLSPAKV